VIVDVPVGPATGVARTSMTFETALERGIFDTDHAVVPDASTNPAPFTWYSTLEIPLLWEAVPAKVARGVVFVL
jgi:hypothetical protein